MITKENTIILPTKLNEEDKELMNCKAVGHLLDIIRYFRTTIHKETNMPASLLDVGCRDDATQSFFTSKGFNWIGIDIKPSTSAILKGDMHNLPIGDESIEFTFCSHALEHSERPLDVMKEFKRITKLSGYIFLATPAYSDYQLFSCDKEHINVPTMKQMKRWAQHVGLEVVHQTYLRNDAYEDRLASLITLLKVVNK